MKLDYDLIREMLLFIEGETNGVDDLQLQDFQEKFSDRKPYILSYHMKYLADAGLVEEIDERVIIDITPYGRDYLNSVRDDSRWAKVKKKLQPVGTVALDVVQSVGKAFLLKDLGL